MEILLLVWLLIGSSFGALNPALFNRNTTKSVNYEMIRAIHHVFREIFLKEFRCVNIIDCVANTSDHYFRDFKNAVHTDMNATGSQFSFRTGNNTFMEESEFQRRMKNLIIIDTPESFVKLHKLLTRNRFNFRGQYLFAFIHGRIKPTERRKIFNMLWKKGIYNVNFLFEENKKSLIITTMRPFRARKCNELDEIVLDTFFRGKFLNGTPELLYPTAKFKNLQKCNISVVTFDRCPALCYSKNKDQEDVYTGYDWEILQELSNRLNFQPVVRFLHGQQQWGQLFENGTGTGGLQILLAKEAEIGIGNYFLVESLTKMLDMSEAYSSTPIVLVIPPAEKLSPFEKLLQPFETIVWILLLLTFAIGFLVIIIINYKFKFIKTFVYGENVSSPAMNMFAAIVGLQQNVLPETNFARFILMMFLLFCLVKRNVYQGVLFDFLQSDGRHRDIQSIDEMMQKDFQFYVYETYSDFIDNKSELYKRKIFVRDESELPFNKEVNETLKAAFMTPLTNVINRNRQNQGKFSLKVCAEHFSIVSNVFFFARDFYLKTVIDEKILYFNDAGLSNYWINKHADKNYLKISAENAEPKKLTIEHLIGVFNIMLIGHAMALIAFVLEVVVSKTKQFREKKRQRDRVVISVFKLRRQLRQKDKGQKT